MHIELGWYALQGHYACCCADTFSSEFGILSKLDPILITTGQVGPKTSVSQIPTGIRKSISLSLASPDNLIRLLTHYKTSADDHVRKGEASEQFFVFLIQMKFEDCE